LRTSLRWKVRSIRRHRPTEKTPTSQNGLSQRCGYVLPSLPCPCRELGQQSLHDLLPSCLSHKSHLCCSLQIPADDGGVSHHLWARPSGSSWDKQKRVLFGISSIHLHIINTGFPQTGNWVCQYCVIHRTIFSALYWLQYVSCNSTSFPSNFSKLSISLS
jgi:hypothetical protein